MISVLCPTRGRPERLAANIPSLRETKADRLELLVAIDPDEDAQDYRDYYPAVMPERYGYGELYRYYNALAVDATPATGCCSRSTTV